MKMKNNGLHYCNLKIVDKFLLFLVTSFCTFALDGMERVICFNLN